MNQGRREERERERASDVSKEVTIDGVACEKRKERERERRPWKQGRVEGGGSRREGGRVCSICHVKLKVSVGDGAWGRAGREVGLLV